MPIYSHLCPECFWPKSTLESQQGNKVMRKCEACYTQFLDKPTQEEKDDWNERP